jgi:mRNA interferase RelE/StbE
MGYQVVIAPPAEKQLAELRFADQKMYKRVSKAIDRLRVDPRHPGYRKLRGDRDDYRVRVGDFRILYTIDDGVVTVTVMRVEHRSSVYD